MTFSDDRVVEILNREFVCAWTNSRPDIHPSQYPVFEDHRFRNWRHGFGQGTGANNVGLLFCTSDGWVLHEMRGFFGPDAFLEEIRFVLSARDELTRNGIHVPFDVAAQGMRERHHLAIVALESGNDLRWKRRRPVAQSREIALRIQFHRNGIAQPLRRVERVHPVIEVDARRPG